MSLNPKEQAIYDSNLHFLSQLHEDVQWAAYQWHHACYQRGLRFRISETRRAQGRQEELYKIGRRGIDGERPVTWTRDSFHTRGLAVDLYPINCTHQDIADVAGVYNITHPFPSADPPHYEFDRVKAPTPIPLPKFFPRTLGSLRMLLTRRLRRARSEIAQARIQKRLDELE